MANFVPTPIYAYDPQLPNSPPNFNPSVRSAYVGRFAQLLGPLYQPTAPAPGYPITR